MAVVAFLGGRAGVGKTTAAIAVASVWQSQGRKVFLVDCDPNGAARAWANRAQAAGRIVPNVSSAWFENEDRALMAARQCDVMVVDCPTEDHPIAGVVLGVANLVVIPCGPTAADVADLSEVLDIVQNAREVRDDLTTSMDEDSLFGSLYARILLNGRTEDGTVSTSFRSALAGVNVSVLENELRKRPAFAAFIGEARTFGELPANDPAAIEVRALADELAQLLEDRTTETSRNDVVEDTQSTGADFSTKSTGDFSTTEITARVMIGRLGAIRRRRSSPQKQARVRVGPALAIELGEVGVENGKLDAPLVVVFGNDIERVTLVPARTNVPLRLLHTFSFEHRGETMPLAVVGGDDGPSIGELTLVFTHKTGPVSGTIEYRVSAEGVVSIALTGNYAGIAEIVLPKRRS